MTEKDILGDEPPRPDYGATDPELRVHDSGGAMWGWIAGIAVLILVVFVLIGGLDFSGTQQPQKKGEAPAGTNISRVG